METINIRLEIIDSNEKDNEYLDIKFSFNSEKITLNNLLDYISQFKTKHRIYPCYEFYYYNSKIDKKQKVIWLIQNIYYFSKITLSLKINECRCKNIFKDFSLSKIIF